MGLLHDHKFVNTRDPNGGERLLSQSLVLSD